MTGRVRMQLVILLYSTAISCNTSSSLEAKNTVAGRSELMLDSAIVEKSIKTLEINSAILYSISDSIYTQLDTMWRFPDGLQAYKFAFWGGAFVDSSGKPIHKRYARALLTTMEIDTLKSRFLSHCYDSVSHSCTPMYRDVLAFLDRSDKQVAQIQICFGCHKTAVYPTAYFDYRRESALNWTQFEQFITRIKK